MTPYFFAPGRALVAAIALSLGVAVCLVVSRRPRSRALARVITGLDAAFMLPLGLWLAGLAGLCVLVLG